jgi:hypothetical protein
MIRSMSGSVSWREQVDRPALDRPLLVEPGEQ